MNNERLLTMPVTINYIDGKKCERERVSEKLFVATVVPMKGCICYDAFINCNVCARARAPKYHQYDRAIDNNNHKYLVHILGSCYCLLAGLSCRFFRYRHHKTNPIITFQFNCVKPVTLTVSRDRRQIYERGNQRAHCTNASNAITMHIFFYSAFG